MAKLKVGSLALWINGEFVGNWRIKSGIDELQYANGGSVLVAN